MLTTNTTDSLDTSTRNSVLVILTQAMLGTVSSNLRMVSIALDQPLWPISFFLEEESAADREAIEEIIATFDVGMMDIDIACSGFEAEIFVIPANQRLPEIPGVKIFLRRETPNTLS